MDVTKATLKNGSLQKKTTYPTLGKEHHRLKNALGKGYMLCYFKGEYSTFLVETAESTQMIKNQEAIL